MHLFSVCANPYVINNDTFRIKGVHVVGPEKQDILQAISTASSSVYYLQETEEFVIFRFPYNTGLSKIKFESQFLQQYEVIITVGEVPETIVS